MLVGWDWATCTHDVTVMDDDGTRVDRWVLPHTEDGLSSTICRLARHGDPATMPVAIEATRGLVVDRLLAAGHPVVPVHPNAFHAVRPRWGATRAKTDAGDSFKLADYLRTDGHQLRRLAPTEASTLSLQALSRARTDLVRARIAATNQLAALLGAHWPGPASLFSRLHSPISLDFLETYPTPEAAQGLTPATLNGFLRRQAYSGRADGQALHDRLGAAARPASRLDPTILAELVHTQVRQVRSLVEGIRTLEQVIAATLPAHPWATLIAPLPRIGTVSHAQVVGEVGPILERARSSDQLAAETGMAPVTYASGKTTTVTFRVAVNTNARQAMVVFADASRRSSPWAADLYAAARSRGKRHPEAIRILGRAWLRVIWACYQTHTPYDPDRHDQAYRRRAAA